MFDALHMSRSLSGEMFALLVTAVACLVALPLMVWRLSGIWRRSPREVSDTDRCLASLTRGTRNFGLVSIAIFWGIFGLWGGLAPLSSAALAPGIVSPDGNRKTVQHLEGGIVRTIDVAEGDVVTAGQVIVRLEDVAARAALVELTERLAFLLAEQARLVAEQSGATSIQFPDEMADFGETGDIAKATQAGLFATRLDTTRERHSILATRVLQLQEQNMGLAAVVDAQVRQQALIGEEIATAQSLVDKGIERRGRLLTLQRVGAEIDASLASNIAAMARNRQAIGEAEFQLLALKADFAEDVAKNLARVRGEIAALRSQLPLRKDRLARTAVRAPVSGRVMNIQITTEEGGVLGAGEPILDIVPDEAPLIIEARLKPSDIDVVRPGQTARVILSAYTQRNLPTMTGTLRSVSADRLTDDRSGEPYFLAHVAIEPEILRAFGANVQMTAGMPADVMIVTGERTLIDYLLRPFFESLSRSFRET